MTSQDLTKFDLLNDQFNSNDFLVFFLPNSRSKLKLTKNKTTIYLSTNYDKVYVLKS